MSVKRNTNVPRVTIQPPMAARWLDSNSNLATVHVHNYVIYIMPKLNKVRNKLLYLLDLTPWRSNS